VTAFAASLYMRGCRLLLVPTTVLAQVDATLGGKTGINFGGHKNMVGSFYPAHEIRIVPELLATLPEREYRGGLAEVIKHGFLTGGELHGRIRDRREAILAREPAVLKQLIWDSLMVKARVVEADLREQGERAHLNLGHTFGHGLESAAGFGVWNHGEAVAWGMVKAAALSVRLGLAPAEYEREVRQTIHDYGYADQAPGIAVEALLTAMLADKKKKGGSVRFVLQTAIGSTQMQAVAEADLLAVLSD
jgi:3-dehydroquinate synthase